MRRSRHLIAILAAMFLIIPAASPALADTANPGHTLVDITVASDPGHDRIVFEFKGGLPHDITADWTTTEPDYVPSGQPSAAQGNAFVVLHFNYATGHIGTPPVSSYGPTARAYDMRNLTQIKEIENSKADLAFAIGVMKQTWVTVDTKLSPARVIVQIGTDFERVPVKIWFGDPSSYGGGAPYMDAVTRLVPADMVAQSLLHRLFAGPTQGEKAAGLELVKSGAKDFTDFSVNTVDVARLQLTGGCQLGPEPISIGTEITRSLKTLVSIDWVKIYDPDGNTTDPDHPTDSLPECLTP